MTPQEFIKKWKPLALTERATAQEHFIDLCRLFDHPTPAEDDPQGDHFTLREGRVQGRRRRGLGRRLEEGLLRVGVQEKKRDLDKAMEQLSRYAAGLENPPVHVACDAHLGALAKLKIEHQAVKDELARLNPPHKPSGMDKRVEGPATDGEKGERSARRRGSRLDKLIIGETVVVKTPALLGSRHKGYQDRFRT